MAETRYGMAWLQETPMAETRMARLEEDLMAEIRYDRSQVAGGSHG